MTEDTKLPSAGNERSIQTLSFVESEIQQRITAFDKRRKFYRTGAYRFTLIAAGLSTLTTILIGVSRIYNSTPISVISLITSAAMSFLSAWEGLYGYRQRWIQNDELVAVYLDEDDISSSFLKLDEDTEYVKYDQQFKQLIEDFNGSSRLVIVNE